VIAQVALPAPDAVVGPVSQAVGDALTKGATSVVGGISGWLFSSLAGLTGAVFGFIDKATTPNVLSAWFIDGTGGPGPYKAMATVAATLMCVLVFGGIVQGIAQADIGGMFRRMVVHIPIAVLGITGTVVVAQILIELTDALSRYLTSSVGSNTEQFVTAVQSLATVSDNGSAPMLVLGLLMLVAALVVFVELLIRSLLVYLIVALCPLAWAALVWPALQAALRKTLELLVAVILSKVVVALAIAVGAAAIGGIGSTQIAPELAGYQYAAPGATASATPETTTTGTGGGLTEGIGLLAIGVATLALAAFSPFLIARLLPFAEAAVVSQGTRGAPLRAGQQVSNISYRLDAVRRFGARGASSGPSTPVRSGNGGGAPDAGTSGAPAPSPRTPAGSSSAATARAPAGSGGAATAGSASAAGATSGAAAGSAGGGAAAGGAVTAAVAAPIVVAGAAVKTAKAVKGRVEQSTATQTSTAGSTRPTDSTGAPSDTSSAPLPSSSSLKRLGERPRPQGGKP